MGFFILCPNWNRYSWPPHVEAFTKGLAQSFRGSLSAQALSWVKHEVIDSADPVKVIGSEIWDPTTCDWWKCWVFHGVVYLYTVPFLAKLPGGARWSCSPLSSTERERLSASAVDKCLQYFAVTTNGKHSPWMFGRQESPFELVNCEELYGA